MDTVIAPLASDLLQHSYYAAPARMRQQQFDGRSGVPIRQTTKASGGRSDAAADEFGGIPSDYAEEYQLTEERIPDIRARRVLSVITDADAVPALADGPSSAHSPPSSSTSAVSGQPLHQRGGSGGHEVRSSPIQLRHGRKYIQNEAYPLPCDLLEIHRQNLKTMLTCSVFGRALCSPRASTHAPLRVLDIGCGSAYWTLKCHEMFSAMGHPDIQYTGLDVANLAPDLKKQGLNWTFVQHDMRSCPWPFDDEAFDFVMCKDMSIVIPLGMPSQRITDECIRLLSVGGTLEIWESDHLIRRLEPHRPAARMTEDEQRIVEQTATFPMSPMTPFASTDNRYLRAANIWIEEVLSERNLAATPCSRVATMLLQETEQLADVGYRRVAIPLTPMDWDAERHMDNDLDHKNRRRKGSKSSKRVLDAEQASLREAALLVVVKTIESLEPLLKKASGKNTEEWGHWWASMLGSLTPSSSSGSPLNGECLEVGAWWATKTSS